MAGIGNMAGRGAGSKSDKADGLDNVQRLRDQGKEFFLRYDQQKSIDRFGLEHDDGFLYVDYLSDSFRVDRETSSVDIRDEDGEWTWFKDPYSAMVIYDMLCHFQDGEGDDSLSGEFCPTQSLTSLAMASSLVKNEHRYDVLMGHTDELASGCERLGGVLQPQKARADITYTIPIFKWFNVIFQFWDGDEEFAPKAMFLWDRNSLSFMHFETLYYVMSDVMTKLWPGFEEYPQRPK